MKRRAVVGAAASRGHRAEGRPTVFDNFHRGLVHVHCELRDDAHQIGLSAADIAADAATDTLIAGFCEQLQNHHKSEDTFFFPAFRAAGRLRSSDVAFLEARDAEHVEIHRLCLELRTTGERHQRGVLATRTWRTSVVELVRDLVAASLPHFTEEESSLTPEHVATMISSDDLVHVFRDMGENWNRR